MAEGRQQLQFEGFDGPNTTPVPDVVFDELMLELDNPELRVLLYIIRRTYGFKRRTDNIALSQMVHGITKKDGTVLDRGTGLSKASVTRGLRGLLEKGIIVARRNRSADRGNEPTTYALRFRGQAPTPPAAESKSPGQTLVSGVRQAPLSQGRDTPLSQQRDTQETVLQDTDSSNIRKGKPDGKTPVDNHSDVENPTSSVDDDPYARGAALTRQALAQAKSRPKEPPKGAKPAPAIPPQPQEPSQHRQEPAEHSRGGDPEPVAAVLMRSGLNSPPVTHADDREAKAAIASYIGEFASQLGDQAPVKSSVTRAYNLYRESGLSLSAFIDQLYRARGAVRELAELRQVTHTGEPIKNRMSYFFATLTDQLHLKPDT